MNEAPTELQLNQYEEQMMQELTTDVKPTLALLKNVSACMSLVEMLTGRAAHLDGIGVFYGPSGFGKTYAAIYVQNRTGGYRLEVGESWTKKIFLKRLLQEIGHINPTGTIGDMTEAIIESLAGDPDRVVIIDEADKLVDKKMIELVREIHMASRVPVLLIGEELLPSKLKRIERVDNRVLEWVPAQPCDNEDARELANMFVPALEIEEALLEEIVKQSQGRARRIVVNLNRLREFCVNAGRTQIDAQTYSGGFYTGEAPRRRGRVS